MVRCVCARDERKRPDGENMRTARANNDGIRGNVGRGAKNSPVNVTVVPRQGLVLYVGGVDGDLPSLLLGGPVDVLVRQGLRPTLLGQDLRDGLGESRLAVIDVPYRSDVHVRLVPIERLLGEASSAR